MKINNSLLEGVNFEKSPNMGGTFNPNSIVLHYTAGASAKSAISVLTNPKNKVSAHLVIDTDGTIIQLAPFNIVTWHAGRSQYKDMKGLNKYSIGIEIVNAGRLRKSGAVYRSWFGKAYPLEDVVCATHRNELFPTYWHAYTEEQIESVYSVCELLVNEYSIEYILGHEEIAPKRKIDPGPAIPLDKMRNRLLNQKELEICDSETDDEKKWKKGYVAASKLNIRKGPSKNYDKVDQILYRGQEINIVDSKDGWYNISTKITGWVSGNYIKEA